jgi:hypothetical protein
LESQAQSTRNIGSISTSRWPPTFPNRVCVIILIPENGKMDEGARHAVVPKIPLSISFATPPQTPAPSTTANRSNN